jgi:hypothetical protein
MHYTRLIRYSRISLINDFISLLILLVLTGCKNQDPTEPPIFPDSPPPQGAFARPPASGSLSGSSSTTGSGSSPFGGSSPFSCSQGGAIFCDPGPHTGSFNAVVSQFSGSSGFLQYNISEVFLEGIARDIGIAALSDASDSGFDGENWIYLKGLDNFSDRPPGSWKLKCRAQGNDEEGSFTGTSDLNPSQTYTIRIEWGNGRAVAFLNDREMTHTNLPVDIIFNGLSLSINDSPRSDVEPGYSGTAIITNIVVGR